MSSGVTDMAVMSSGSIDEEADGDNRPRERGMSREERLMCLNFLMEGEAEECPRGGGLERQKYIRSDESPSMTPRVGSRADEECANESSSFHTSFDSVADWREEEENATARTDASSNSKDLVRGEHTSAKKNISFDSIDWDNGRRNEDGETATRTRGGRKRASTRRCTSFDCLD